MRYGLLAYRDTANLGDEIQSLAARRFLPRVDVEIERDRISEADASPDDPVALICNGWFMHRPDRWPPPRGLVPLLISMHLADPSITVGPLQTSVGELLLAPPAVEYLRHWGPVGARDVGTLAQLEAADVPAYLSACLTLTLERDPSATRGDEVLAVDLPPAVVEAVQARTSRNVVTLTHRDNETEGFPARADRAQALLDRYQRAHCVVTRRLHAALPCLAYETPVVVVLPEQDRERFDGFEQLLRVTEIDAVVAGRVDLDVDRPPPNGRDHLPYRQALHDAVTAWVARLERGDVPDPGPPIRPVERRPADATSRSARPSILRRLARRVRALRPGRG